MTSVLHWSDSRKRSRFTAAGGVAITAIPMSELRQRLDDLHTSTDSQLSALSESTNPALIPDRLSKGCALCNDDKRLALLRSLKEVEADQQRAADGSYGICLGCVRSI